MVSSPLLTAVAGLKDGSIATPGGLPRVLVIVTLFASMLVFLPTKVLIVGVAVTLASATPTASAPTLKPSALASPSIAALDLTIKSFFSLIWLLSPMEA